MWWLGSVMCNICRIASHFTADVSLICFLFMTLFFEIGQCRTIPARTMKRRWTTAPWSLKCCVKGARQCMRNCRDWMSCAPKRRRITRHWQMPVCNTVVVYCFHSWNAFYYSILLQFYTILLLFSDSNYDALKQFILWATPSLGLTFASQSAVCSLCILSTHSAWIDAFDMACHHKPRKEVGYPKQGADTSKRPCLPLSTSGKGEWNA